RSVGEYRRALDGGDVAAAVSWSERLGPRERLGETWWLGLRTTAGVDPEFARVRAGLGPGEDAAARATADGFVGQGLLERTAGGRYRLSARGWPLADAVSSAFVATPASSAHDRTGGLG
ncbi:MAG TPA: hypothetical protein VMT18_05790, partial [Planctomycetota bacterium]|nr:hypothetical protein [Planctomycetota bacterium]